MLVVIIIIIIMVVVHHYCHGGGDHHHYHQWWSSLLSWWWWSSSLSSVVIIIIVMVVVIIIINMVVIMILMMARLTFPAGDHSHAPLLLYWSTQCSFSFSGVIKIWLVNLLNDDHHRHQYITIIINISSSSWSPKNCSMLPLSPPSPAPPSLPKSPKQRHRGGRTLESAMFSKLIFMKYHLCWNSPGQKAGVFALPRFNNDNTSSRRGSWLRRSTCWFHTFATKYTYLLNQDWPGRLILNYNELVLGSAICFKLLYFLFHFHFLTNAIKHRRGLQVY